MASLSGMIGGCGSYLLKNSKLMRKRNDRFRVCSVSSSSSSLSDHYKTLRIHGGASESEVKKAFRQLALKYHPDVCRGNNCEVQFHQINEAYDTVMSKLRGESTASEMEMNYGPSDAAAGTDQDDEDGATYDPDWDTWEEWMGWEGAGIPNYASHTNPYV